MLTPSVNTSLTLGGGNGVIDVAKKSKKAKKAKKGKKGKK
jgi:hypothetical protein